PLSARFAPIVSILSATFSAFASILSAVCSCGLLLQAASEPRPKAIAKMVVVFMGFPFFRSFRARARRVAVQQYARRPIAVPCVAGCPCPLPVEPKGLHSRKARSGKRDRHRRPMG